MRILVCGGREFNDYKFVRNTLNAICDEFDLWDEEFKLPKDVTIIHGGARGADRCADRWAVVNWTGLKEFKVTKKDWENIDAPGAVIKVRKDGTKYNALAGHWRNQKMIDEGKPDLVIAFPGGTGTADMIRRAKAAEIPVRQVAA